MQGRCTTGSTHATDATRDAGIEGTQLGMSERFESEWQTEITG